MKKLLFWIVLSIAFFLFAESLVLDYPLGYHTNTVVYILFLGLCVFGLPEDYRSMLRKRFGLLSRACTVPGCLFLLLFSIWFGACTINLIDPLDFNDETLCLTEEFRVIATSEVVLSDDQKYFAVLMRRGIGEYCVFRPAYCRKVEKPIILINDGEIGLILLSQEKLGNDTLWFESGVFY